MNGYIMELLTIRDPDLVVAIDIGSTYSGYAWQWRDDFRYNRGNVEFNMNWGGGVSQFHKTKTCLLLDNMKEISAFGNLADERFCREQAKDPNNMIEKWYLYKRFKLYLYKKEIPEHCEDELGQILPLEYVMSKFIQALKDHFLKQMETKRQTLNLKKTLWVLTVPQIWSANAREFMRQCGQKAGIDRKNLLLALEPEAAAIACVHLPQQQKEAMGNLGQVGDKFITADLGVYLKGRGYNCPAFRITKQFSFLIVSRLHVHLPAKRGTIGKLFAPIGDPERRAVSEDCHMYFAGGTADISVIEILPEGFIKEIYPGQGSLVGGQDVNNAFFQACTDLFDKTVWTEMFSPSNADDLLRLEDDFESRKIAIGAEQDDQYISLNIPRSMERKLEDKSLSLSETAKESKYFKSDRGQLMFDPKYVREILFNETVARILKIIGETLAKVEVVTKIILVGGFSESPVVVESIRKAMSKEFPEVSIYVPTSPFRAVLYGAVLYGHDRFIFESRISRETYGIKTNAIFDETKHDQDKRRSNADTGKDYCADIFSIHVRKGDSVKLQERQPTQTYNPLYLGQTQMTVSIYSSPSREPKHTTDPGCKKHGEITVDMPDTTGELTRKVTVTMVYGGTELAVTATDQTTGKEFETKIRFDTS